MAKIIRDNLNVDQDWEAFSWTDSTKAVSGGEFTITGGTNYKTNTWGKAGIEGLNVVISTKFVKNGDAFHQIQVRAKSSSEFLLCYESAGVFHIGRSNPSLVSIDSVTIVDFSDSATYYMELLVFGDMLMGTIYNEDGTVNVQLIERSATISSFTGTKCGIGAATNATYKDIEARVLSEYYNVVCFGDSNTAGNGVEDWESWSEQNSKKRRVEGLSSINAGISGNKVNDLISRQAADIDPYITSGAHNVCVVFIGTNNHADVPADVWAEMQTLIGNLKTAGWQVYMCTYPHSYSSRVTFINALEDLVTGGAAGEGAGLIDIYTAFGCTDGGTSFVTAGLTQDGDVLHFSPTGHRLISREVLKQVRNNERTSI